MANCPAGSVDVVIVVSTDRVGPAEGLFIKDFYASCFRALKDDGILVQQSESPLAQLELIKAMRAEMRSEEHTSELQSRENLVCRLLLEKKKHQRSNERSSSNN